MRNKTESLMTFIPTTKSSLTRISQTRLTSCILATLPEWGAPGFGPEGGYLKGWTLGKWAWAIPPIWGAPGFGPEGGYLKGRILRKWAWVILLAWGGPGFGPEGGYLSGWILEKWAWTTLPAWGAPGFGPDGGYLNGTILEKWAGSHCWHEEYLIGLKKKLGLPNWELEANNLALALSASLLPA